MPFKWLQFIPALDAVPLAEMLSPGYLSQQSNVCCCHAQKYHIPNPSQLHSTATNFVHCTSSHKPSIMLKPDADPYRLRIKGSKRQLPSTTLEAIQNTSSPLCRQPTSILACMIVSVVRTPLHVSTLYVVNAQLCMRQPFD